MNSNLRAILAIFVLPSIIVAWSDTARSGGFGDGGHDALGPRFRASPQTPEVVSRHESGQVVDLTSRLLHWNKILCDANALDHTLVKSGDDRIYGEQLGPARTSRAFAIVHIAMADAVNAIAHRYPSFTGIPSVAEATSMDAAVAQAAHDTLAALYPSQAATFDAALTEDLGQIPGASTAKSNGIDLGHRAADAILRLRDNDGSQYTEPRVGVDFITNDEPGQWRQDPLSETPLALGAYWGKVKPFVIKSGDQFRAPPPPALYSPAYAAAFEEVKRLGGDGIVTATQRTPDQTITAIYWAYDGTPSLGTPPRLYNEIAVQIAVQKGTSGVELARLLALANVAMADTGIGLWESKFHYRFWRPVIGIRESDEGTGPIGAGDGNSATIGDPTFTPLGAPASNLIGPNFTPPFPAYPSGHAGLGSALFQTLRRFYGTDDIPFSFVSDELNGVTLDNTGHVRRAVPARSFSSLSQAEEENGQSRIYLGIHWAFDKTEGMAMGRRVADYVFEQSALQPR